jgi:hypothetical protein
VRVLGDDGGQREGIEDEELLGELGAQSPVAEIDEPLQLVRRHEV